MFHTKILLTCNYQEEVKGLLNFCEFKPEEPERILCENDVKTSSW